MPTPTTAEPTEPPATPAPGTVAQPSGATAATTQTSAVTPAARTDLNAGVEVFDTAGASVGKIETVTATGAIVATGKVRAQLPLASFGKNAKGLVITMNKTELEAAAAAKAPPGQ
jgi:hypothetical protein